MKEKPFSPELEKALASYVDNGGVIEFALFELPPGESCTLVHHRDAAVESLGVFDRRIRRAMEAQGIPYVPDPGLRLEPSKMRARKIDLPEFLGPRCDPDGRTLRFVNGSTSDSWKGFAYAFSDPPYKVQSQARCQDLFNGILHLLFGPMVRLDIMEWNTEWSSYFDPGREWWGSFCWTVYTPNRRHLVAMAASTTD